MEHVIGQKMRDMPNLAVQVGMGAAPNAFLEKLEPQHIDKVLDYTHADEGKEHVRQLCYFFGGLVGFLVLCAMFLYAGKDGVLEKIIAAFIGFVGGFGVGKWSKK